MSALDELRRAYRALGWSLWRRDGTAGLEQVTWYYATTAHGRFIPEQGETIRTISPLATLTEVLAHPTTSRALGT